VVLGCRSGESPARGAQNVEAAVVTGIVQAGGIAPQPIRLDTLTNPNGSNREAADAGGKVFQAMNCDGCHGDGATGWVGPSLVDGRWRHGGSDAELFQSVYFGRPRGMPAYGGLMSAEMVWQVVSYIRSQPVPADVPTEAFTGSP
jgi:cytochrome c oxidase cbb3-type subunit 3